MEVQDLPTLNAVLNGTSAILLTTGYYFVRRKETRRHRNAMIGALISSSLFLISYLVYHAQIGSRPYQGQGWIRFVYFSILISHTVLAATLVPLVIMTVSRAWKGRFLRHRKIARYTLPVWIYVSITGVVIYSMLYLA
jgi:uncharacterized membrane protein YozB (DUF420 family)